MEGHLKALGRTTTCMVMVLIPGVMEENMKENITWTKNMGMEFIIGLMEDAMKDTGKMENSMEKENIFYLMGLLKLVYGKMVKE